MIDIQQTKQRLQDHVHALTVTIGERSVRVPENLKKTALYIGSFLRDLGLTVDHQAYSVDGFLQQLRAAGVLAVPFGPSLVRMVTHLDVSADDIEAVGDVLAALKPR